MNLTVKRRNLIFWILQICGWGFLNLTSILFLKKLGLQFVIFSLVTGLLIGIGSSTLLRYYLRAKVSLENFDLRQFLKIVLATIVASAIYGFLSYFTGRAYGKFGPEISETEKEILKAFDNIWILVFNSIFIMICWVICYLVIKLLLKANQNRIERLELNTSLKQAQLNTLKGQINPHFMFNSLNNIRGLMLEDVNRSREMLTKLSEILRYSLTKNNVNAIAVEEELDMVDNYIALSKIQFENRLQFERTIEDNCLLLQIPPMIIQLLVENAMKHGISNLKEGGKIVLEIRKKEDKLQLCVTNTGKLQISKDSTQLGLKNIRQRLHLLYGDKAEFTLNEIEHEVVANIKIPLT